MRMNTRRGRVLVLLEPLGIVRSIGSLMLICAFVSLARGLIMLKNHESSAGFSSPHFWILIAVATAVLGLLLSSPPRWRWVFDIDLNKVRSLKTIFGIPAGEVQSFEMTRVDKAEVISGVDRKYSLHVIDTRGKSIPIDGIVSKSEGMPKIAAFRLNELIGASKEHLRRESDLNDPGVTLREAGIYAPVDPLTVGPAVDSFERSVPSTITRRLTDTSGAIAVCTYMAHRFNQSTTPGGVYPDLDRLTDLQLMLAFDLMIQPLRKMTRAQYLDLSKIVTPSSAHPFQDQIYAFALSSRFDRYVGKFFRSTNVEPPAAADLSSVLPECLKIIATVAHAAHSSERMLMSPKSLQGKEVVFVDPSTHQRMSLLTRKAYDAGVEELSSGLRVEGTAHLSTAQLVTADLARIEQTAPVPMRNVFLRACARTAASDGLLEPRLWVLLRGIADTLTVAVPSFVHEPVVEARVDILHSRGGAPPLTRTD